MTNGVDAGEPETTLLPLLARTDRRARHPDVVTLTAANVSLRARLGDVCDATAVSFAFSELQPDFEPD